MATSSRVAEALSKTKPVPAQSSLDLLLPEFQETPRSQYPMQASWLIIGPPKTGKSRLVEHISRAHLEMTGKPILHLDLENGAHQISGAKVHILNLGELDRYLQALRNGAADRYSGFALDPTDMLNEWCDQLACAELKIQAIGQAEFGKDYTASRNHFMKRMLALKSIGKTLILVSHTKQEKRDTASQTRPNLTGQLAEMVMGHSDSIAYLSIEKLKGGKSKGQETPDTYERTLSFAGHEGLCAGSRFECLNGNKFVIPDLSSWPVANLWSPVLDAFKVSDTES